MLLPFALVSGDQAVNKAAFAAATTYILIYAVMTLGAFAVVIALTRESPSLLISDFAGLVRRAPVLGIGMIVFMVSLGGVPPTGGFWAKFFVFTAAISRGGLGPWLAVIMVLNSVISLYYYLRVAREVVFVEPRVERPPASPVLVTGVAALATFAILAIGIYPELLVHFPPLSTLAGP